MVFLPVNPAVPSPLQKARDEALTSWFFYLLIQLVPSPLEKGRDEA